MHQNGPRWYWGAGEKYQSKSRSLVAISTIWKKEKFHTVRYLKLYTVRPSTHTMENSFFCDLLPLTVHTFSIQENRSCSTFNSQRQSRFGASNLHFHWGSEVSLSAISDIFHTVRLRTDTCQNLHIFNITIRAETRATSLPWKCSTYPLLALLLITVRDLVQGETMRYILELQILRLELRVHIRNISW